MPTPSVSTFTFPSTTEPVFSASTTKEAPAKEAPAKPSLFAAGSSSAGGTDPAPGGFSDVSGSDFLVGGIRTVVDPEFDLQKVYVPQWSVTNGSCLDDGRVCREMLDEFAPPKFFASIRGMEHDQLFTEFNVGTARQISLSAEVRMRAEYNIKEKRRLKAVVEEKDMLLKTKGEEIDSLSAQLLLKEAEAAEAIHLRAEASRFGVVEKSLRDEVKYLRERNAALEEEKGVLNVKVADLTATVKVREQEAADSDALVTAVKLQNDSLADQVYAMEASSAGLQEKVTAYEKFVDQLEKFQDDKIKEVNDKLEKLDADVVAMKAGRKIKFNNKDAARFDKKKVKCYKCSELGHFARECTGKQLDSKERYSSFKLKELDKSEEPKALLSVDSMLNWSDHEGKDVENGARQVYGMIARAEDDAAGSATGDATGDVADDVSNAAAEFAL
ncbi:reverse transcriptase domain-containing protein, partial [Tanacetum coccineum]